MAKRTSLTTGGEEVFRPSSTLRNIVKRFTSLSSALDTLAHRRVVLLNPTKWDDTNDSYFMELYRLESGAGSVLALCCTRATETYHHWRVFTDGNDGVCVEFFRRPFEAALKAMGDVEARPVSYLRVKDLEEFTALDVARLPFIKRLGFKDEREWRVIAHTSDVAVEALPIGIELNWVNRIVTNPWMPPGLVDNLREIVHRLDDCGGVRVEPSRLTNSRRWKAAGKKLCTVC